MLAIGRGLMARPKLLLLDEPSLGLAPLIVKQIFEMKSNDLPISLIATRVGLSNQKVRNIIKTHKPRFMNS